MLSLFLPAGIIVAAGLVTLSSVSAHLFFLQIIWVALGIGLVALFYFVDWRIILNYRWIIGGLYALAVVLLLFVYLKGPVVRNVRSWIVLGSLNFQPVELAKIALILLYAAYFAKRHLGIARWKNIFTSFVFFAIPAFLTAIEPELGSAIIIFGIWFGFLLLSGLPPRRVAAAVLVFIAAGAIIWLYGLKDYQRARILGFLYPARDVLGINYSAAQSRIAIGSPGFWGKGYGQGTQTQLGFLTEPASDFALAAFVEEWGAAGGIVVVSALLFFVLKILMIGAEAERNFEKFICLGSSIIFGAQFFLNAGSATGLTPVVGIPFPFLSYGGSDALASFFMLALVNAIHTRKYK